jgi:hypothetical protein
MLGVLDAPITIKRQKNRLRSSFMIMCVNPRRPASARTILSDLYAVVIRPPLFDRLLNHIGGEIFIERFLYQDEILVVTGKS